MALTATNPRPNPLWFVAAPITGLVARSIWTPLDDEEPARYLSDLAGNELAGVGALLMFASAVLLIPAAFALASVLREGKRRLARTAVGMIVTGAAGMASFGVLGLIAAQIAEHPDRTTMLSLWEQIMDDAGGAVLFLAVIAGVIGFVVLAVGLFRSHAVPGAAAVLVGLGGATTLFTTGGPMRPLLLAASALALAGFGWVATATRKAELQSPVTYERRVAA